MFGLTAITYLLVGRGGAAAPVPPPRRCPCARTGRRRPGPRCSDSSRRPQVESTAARSSIASPRCAEQVGRLEQRRPPRARAPRPRRGVPRARAPGRARRARVACVSDVLRRGARGGLGRAARRPPPARPWASTAWASSAVVVASAAPSPIAESSSTSSRSSASARSGWPASSRTNASRCETPAPSPPSSSQDLRPPRPAAPPRRRGRRAWRAGRRAGSAPRRSRSGSPRTSARNASRRRIAASAGVGPERRRGRAPADDLEQVALQAGRSARAPARAQAVVGLRHPAGVPRELAAQQPRRGTRRRTSPASAVHVGVAATLPGRAPGSVSSRTSSRSTSARARRRGSAAPPRPPRRARGRRPPRGRPRTARRRARAAARRRRAARPRAPAAARPPRGRRAAARPRRRPRAAPPPRARAPASGSPSAARAAYASARWWPAVSSCVAGLRVEPARDRLVQLGAPARGRLR